MIFKRITKKDVRKPFEVGISATKTGEKAPEAVRCAQELLAEPVASGPSRVP